MVLEEASELILIVQRRDQMVAYRPSAPLAQSIVEPLVVAVIEPLLLQGPFQVPVHFRHEQEAGYCSRTFAIARGQNGAISMPQVRRNTSGRMSIAMSQRTPSHRPAISSSSAMRASCRSGLP